MSNAVARIAVDLEPLHCGECGINFAVPDWWLSARRDKGESGGQFWCPNGHVRVFAESELDRVRRELKAAQDTADWHRRRAEERDRQLTASRGQLTRLRNRVQRGVCPDCKRSFPNLRRHMETKHPQLALPAPK